MSLFGLYQFGDVEMRTLKVAVVDELMENSSMTQEEAQAWGAALTFHHQWMVLSREHVTALVQDMKDLMLVRHTLCFGTLKEPDYTNSFMRHISTHHPWGPHFMSGLSCH